MTVPVPAADMIFKRFSVDGAEVTYDMAVDGTTPVNYDVIADQAWQVERINFGYLDGTCTPGNFGGISALTNGIAIKVLAADGSTVLLDYTDGIGIKTNNGWAVLAGTDLPVDGTAADGGVAVRWTLSKAGAPLRLGGDERIRIIIADDLTGLVSFEAMLHGVKL